MSAAATYPVGTIAKLLMLTDRRVQQLSKEGVLPRAERGRYELVPAVQGYVKYLKDRAIGGDIPLDSIGDHKVRLLKARADIAEFEAERLAETLIPAEDVERVWTAAVGRFRQRSLAAAPKAAPMVAVETEPDVCQAIIESAIYEALAELAATDIEIEGAPVSSGTFEEGIQESGTAPEIDGESMGGSVSEAEPGSERGSRPVGNGAG